MPKDKPKPLDLLDVRWKKPKTGIANLSAGTRKLIRCIIEQADDDTVNIPVYGGFKHWSWFQLHPDTKRDPLSNGDRLSSKVTVMVYHRPATYEHDKSEALTPGGTIDGSNYTKSGKNRLAHRIEDGKHSFHVMSHPPKKGGLTDNSIYQGYMVVDCTGWEQV